MSSSDHFEVQPLPAVMTVPEAARVLGIARSTLDLLIRRGEVESVLIGQRNRRITGQALAAYLARAVDTAVHAAAAPAPFPQSRPRRRVAASAIEAEAVAYWEAAAARTRRRQAGPTSAEADDFWAQFGSRRRSGG